jgi:hypothetical protein
MTSMAFDEEREYLAAVTTHAAKGLDREDRQHEQIRLPNIGPSGPKLPSPLVRPLDDGRLFAPLLRRPHRRAHVVPVCTAAWLWLDPGTQFDRIFSNLRDQRDGGVAVQVDGRRASMNPASGHVGPGS